MSNIHGLTDEEFAGFEKDMFDSAGTSFNAWVSRMEADNDMREGWRDLSVFAKRTSRYSVIIDVAVDGYALYSVTYHHDFGEGWNEASYLDTADGRKMIKPSVYKELGYTRLEGWRWNEYTDDYEIDLSGLDALPYQGLRHDFSRRYPVGG